MDTVTPATVSYGRHTGPADALAAAEDASWFAQRPTRAYRLRRALPCELGLPARTGLLVVVRSVIDGFRLRVPLRATPKAAKMLLRDRREELAAVVWNDTAPPRLHELARAAGKVAHEYHRSRSIN